jgi:plastocyanin
VFKPIQIFLFSLVPLALVFAGVIFGSMNGVDSDLEEFPTAVANGGGGPPPTPSAPGETVIQLRAANLAFDKTSLSATANQPVNVQFENADAGVLHNFALYVNASASQKIFGGELTTGVTTVNYKFTAPAAGSYFFRCDVHPDTMKGSFASR